MQGWFVAPSAYNPALRWLIELNPSHYLFQAITVSSFSGEEFPCESESGGSANQSQTLEQLCPLPGEMIIDQYLLRTTVLHVIQIPQLTPDSSSICDTFLVRSRYEMDDRPEVDALLTLVWIAVIYLVIHMKMLTWKKSPCSLLPLHPFSSALSALYS